MSLYWLAPHYLSMRMAAVRGCYEGPIMQGTPIKRRKNTSLDKNESTPPAPGLEGVQGTNGSSSNGSSPAAPDSGGRNDAGAGTNTTASGPQYVTPDGECDLAVEQFISLGYHPEDVQRAMGAFVDRWAVHHMGRINMGRT